MTGLLLMNKEDKKIESILTLTDSQGNTFNIKIQNIYCCDDEGCYEFEGHRMDNNEYFCGRIRY